MILGIFPRVEITKSFRFDTTPAQRDTTCVKMSEEEEQIIAKDQASNPNCGYSRSLSRSCSYHSDKRGLVCETLRQIVRQCPGKPPVQILESKTSGEEQGLLGRDPASEPLLDMFKGVFGGFGGLNDGQQKDLDELVKALAKTHGTRLGTTPVPVPKNNKQWSIKDFDSDDVERA